MSRELATVATSSITGKLSAIEILARHRELCGYDTLDELASVLKICSQRPAACQVVLNGPDTVFISRFEPAVDFLLREIGFQTRKEVIGGGGGDGHETSILNGSAHHGGKGGASIASSRRAPKEITSLVMPRPASWQPGMPEPVVSEDSADWRLFKHKIQQGQQLVEWARWANTSLLTVRLTDVVWFRPPTSAYGFEVRMTWVNVLGREQGQLFSIGDTKYTGVHPNVLEVCDSKCDGPCTVNIYVYRDRPVLPRKLVGKATLQYDNSGVVDTRIDIIDPSVATPADTADTPTPTGPSGAQAAAARAEAQGGRPVPENVRGSIRVEVASVRHRYTQLQEDLLVEMAVKREAERRERVAAEELAKIERREERRRQREEADRLRAARVGGSDTNDAREAPGLHKRTASAASSTGAVRSDAGTPTELAATTAGRSDDVDAPADPDVSAIAPDTDDAVPAPADCSDVADAEARGGNDEAPSSAAPAKRETAELPPVAAPPPVVSLPGAEVATPKINISAAATASTSEAASFSAAEVRRAASDANSGTSPSAPDANSARRRRRRHAASDDED